MHHCLTTFTNLAVRNFVPTNRNFLYPFLYKFLCRVLRHHLGYRLRPGTVCSQFFLLYSEREQVIIYCASECSISLNHSAKAHLTVTFRSLVFIRCQGSLEMKHQEETPRSSEAPDIRELLPDSLATTSLHPS